MKIITANDKKTLRLNKSEWEKIGLAAGWNTEFPEMTEKDWENLKKPQVEATIIVLDPNDEKVGSWQDRDVHGQWDELDKAFQYAQQGQVGGKVLIKYKGGGVSQYRISELALGYNQVDKVASSVKQDIIIKAQTEPPFMVDLNQRRRAIPLTQKNRINRAIHALGNYHEEIPLGRIFEICQENGVKVLQEDGTPWSGFLVGGAECGSEKANSQIAHFDLAVDRDGQWNPSNNILNMTWCVMPSGKYEIVAYVS